ncbi:hypothetical protein, partial [Pseudomonas sp. FSL R10-0056]|uniref:hypothetical protein n=1 Tax=Pseudomonas sp. FSL R10-0056 TaxID=2662192 RepID=UPI0015B47683
PGLRLIYATRTGYQIGAQTKANKHKIDLLIVREGSDEDWTAPDGTPLIKTISLNISSISPPRITSFSPGVDKSWLESQPGLDLEGIDQKLGMALNDEVFIANEATGSTISLHTLAGLLPVKFPGITYGKGVYSEDLNDSYLEYEGGGIRLKIKGYKLAYEYHEPVNVMSVIDYSKELLGIVQNYSSGDKKMVFREGMVK